MTIWEALRPAPGERVAVVGCGGKTTFVDLMAGAGRANRVLIMTTTKIRPPRQDGVLLCETLAECLAHKPQPGVQCLGVLNAQRGKFCAPPPQTWPRLTEGYDLVLMEADGSRSLPCKGWAKDEPVVPAFTSTTVGIVTLLALGKPAGPGTVLRMPEFTRLTGVSQGQAISLRTLADMIARPGGMFKSARGRQVLLINQVEDAAAMETARALAALLREEYPAAPKNIFAGSMIENRWCMV